MKQLNNINSPKAEDLSSVNCELPISNIGKLVVEDNICRVEYIAISD